jgi:hypothetical protein
VVQLIFMYPHMDRIAAVAAVLGVILVFIDYLYA